MAKPLPPDVLALMPEGIEKLVLRCVICGLPLPSSRRAYGDHAGACHKVRTLYRRYIIQLTRCISCLHPSTPEERELFKQWRVSRGDLRGRGMRLGGRRKTFTTEARKPGENLEVENQGTKLANISTAMHIDTQAGDSVACDVLSSSTES